MLLWLYRHWRWLSSAEQRARTARSICEESVRCGRGLYIIRSSYMSLGYHCKEGPDNLVLVLWPINLVTVLNVAKLSLIPM